MKCVGLLGELAGYEHGFGWHFPLLEADKELVAPFLQRWDPSLLRVVSAARAESALMIDDFEIEEGALLIVRGATYRRNQEILGIDSRLRWIQSVREFDVAAAPIEEFEDEEQRVRDRALTAFWSALVAANQDECRSALHLLRVNAQLDRLTPVVLRAVLHGRFLDPVGLERTAELARARAGIEPGELVDKASELLRLLTRANAELDVGDLLADLNATLGELSPVIRLDQLVQQRALADLVDVVIHEVEKSVKQHSPLRIRSSGVRQGQVLSTPALALLAHLLRSGEYGKQLLLDEADSPAQPALERSGLMELIDPTPIGTQVALAVSHVEARKTASTFHVVGFHRPPEKTYEHLSSSEIPRWIRSACASSPVRHRDRVARAIAQLLDNVRDHASMTRESESESGVYLSVTKGGGAESTNRLIALVFDNGGGLRSSLERECGPLQNSTADLLRWLFAGDMRPAEADRPLLEPAVGAGFREITATVRRVGEFAQKHAEKPARSHLTVVTSSQNEGKTELVVADLLAEDEPWIKTFVSPTRVTGTTVMLSIPLAPDDALEDLVDGDVLLGEAATAEVDHDDAVVTESPG